MASAITGKCFVTPNRCHNCTRKFCDWYTQDNMDTQCKAKTRETENKSMSESSSGIDEKGERSSQQEMKKEKCEKSIGKDEKGNTKGQKYKIDDKKEKMDNKTKPKNDYDKEKRDDRKVFKRCTGCLLMTYCDKTCQKEHWFRVHKFHCAHLSGKKGSSEHQESSCEDCIANETASKDELFDINSPNTGCRIKEESNRMRRELGVMFGFHGDGQRCKCGNLFACEHSFPIGKIKGSAIATGMDEMTAHAAKLSNAFIIKAMKANEKKEIIDRLLVLHKSILGCRVDLWKQIMVYGDIMSTMWIRGLLIGSVQDVHNKVDIENPWWKSLGFSLSCIIKMADSRDIIRLDVSEITDPKLIEKFGHHQENIKNVSVVTKNNLWQRFKLWPSKLNNSLVLSLPKDVFCFSCNVDLSDQVVGHVNAWDPSNPSPSLFRGVRSNEGVIATCSPLRNFDCGKECCDKINALNLTDEEKQEIQNLVEKSRICHMCLKMSPSSHRCTECLAAQYCSKYCQEKDWKDFHQTVCSFWAEDPARRLMSSKKQKQVTKEKVYINCKTRYC